MQAGRLRFRLELERPVQVRDDIGGVRQDWETVTTVWGDITPLKGRELEAAQKLEARASHTITLRYYPDFASTWRLRKAGTTRVFEVVDVQDTHERHRMLEIVAMEID